MLLLLLPRCDGFYVSAAISTTSRCTSCRAGVLVATDASGGNDNPESTDWEDAMRSLRQRQREASGSESEQSAEGKESQPKVNPDKDPWTTDQQQQPPAPAPAPSLPPPPSWLKADASAPPASGGSGFRYERKVDGPAQQDFIAGLDERDQKLVRNGILYGGRALTFITIASLAFYIYIGVSGGITDGFDRFSEPIEDIRDTIAREGVNPF